MAITHEAILTTDNDRPFTVHDPEPLASASQFIFISDRVWDQRDPGIVDAASWSTTADLDAREALQEVTAQLQELDERFDISTGDKGLKLSGSWNEKVTISRSRLVTPSQSALTTCNWDSLFDSRTVLVDERRHVARFTDGHRDYSRELSTKFWFRVNELTLVASFTMQRHQYDQDQPVTVGASAWYSRFAETGYEGSGICRVELSEQQELALLETFARIGGISLDDQTQA